MSLRTISDTELRALVKWSTRYSAAAQAELDRRLAERQQAASVPPPIVARDAGNVFPNGRWS